MKLSVVVGTYNRLNLLRRCLSSIQAQTRTPVRVHVSDAGSTDGTVPYLREMAGDRLIPIFEDRKLGQARAYNDVFRRLQEPYVAWLSDDNEVVNGGLDVAVRILDHRPEVGMVALKVKDVSGPFAYAPYVGGLSSIGILNVNQGVLRMSVLRQIGGFNEEFRDYGIDADLTARVLFRGHTVVYTRPVALHHHRTWPDDRCSDAFRNLQEKHRRYLSLYEQLYGRTAQSADGTAWRIKRWVYRRLRARFERWLNEVSSRTVLGVNTRDLQHVLGGRYLRLLDPVLSWGRSFHLVQYCPSWARPLRGPLAFPSALSELPGSERIDPSLLATGTATEK